VPILLREGLILRVSGALKVTNDGPFTITMFTALFSTSVVAGRI
jgi:hypothetical protein